MEEVNQNQNPDTQETPEVQATDLAARIAELETENRRLKTASDKNASEAAEYKRRWKSSVSEAEQAALEKEDADKAMRAELETLRRESSKAKLEREFLSAGYPTDLASRAADAQLDGNVAEVLSVQKQFLESQKKDMMDKLTKSMPLSKISNDDSTTLTQAEFDMMSLSAQVELKHNNPELYAKFTS